MFISNISPSALRKLRWTLASLGLALIVAFIVIEYLWMDYLWGDSAISSVWDIFLRRFVGHLFFFVIAISVLRWPIVGGVIMFANGGLLFFYYLISILQPLIDGSAIDGYSYVLSGMVATFILLIIGIVITLIGLRERKMSISSI
jgi:hypothetical protein